MPHPSEGHLASYAVRSCDGFRRTHPEPEDPLRSPFELDRHRIIESTSFRRLEQKTQVFAPSHHDHFRTRLTHTLEASQIARCLAVKLRANELLAEAVTLAHDLGHPPFGHAGETALNQAMVAQGGFNHNAHSLRVVDYLEHPFPVFRGLNLTAETQAGLITHTTRYDLPATAVGAGARGDQQSGAAGSSPRGAGSYRKSCDDLLIGSSVEAQVSSVADRIAYNCHDLEDAIGAEFVDLNDLKNVALWNRAYEQAVPAHRDRERHKHIHAIRRVVLDAMLDVVLTDVIGTSCERLAAVQSPQQARESQRSLVAPAAEIDTQLVELEQFLFERVYQHPEVTKMDVKGRRMVLALFDAYRTKPDALPRRFAARIDDQGLDRVICDYIAGMTDRFCMAEHKRLEQP